MKRISARAVLCDVSGNICLMHRIKRGDEYWVAPGGQLEIGETALQAVVREVMEEVGSSLEIVQAEPVFMFEGPEHLQYYFSCIETSRITPTGPEHQNYDAENIYNVRFLSVESLADLEIRPAEIKAEFITAAYNLRECLFNHG